MRRSSRPTERAVSTIDAQVSSGSGTPPARRWARMRTCQNPVCQTAFYDSTRNGNRVWHDTKTCGNIMNLRASRARKH